MDFLNRQPHPETDEIACIRRAPDARPLRPALAQDVLACACAYWGGRYRLLAAPACAPDTVLLYEGASPASLAEAGDMIRCPAPVRSLSWLLRPGAPLVCVLADAVYFFDPDGTPRGAVALQAQSATAYWDGDGAYLVTEGGVHPLTASLSLTGRAPYPVRATPYLGPDNRTDALWEAGRTNPGTSGGMLFGHGGRLYYVCGDTFGRSALENRDTFICEVRRLDLPYSRRYLAIPNGGAACLFEGEGGRVYAAFVGQTAQSCVRGKAAILPMDDVGGQFFRPDAHTLLEALPSAQLKPVDGITSLRDSFIFAAPDGCYYLTGTSPGADGSYLRGTSAIRLWRSRDLRSFEALGAVYDYSGCPGSWQGRISRDQNSWAPEIAYHGGTYWITYSTAPGCGLLRSASGMPQGPYEDMGRAVHRGIDAGFFQEDGRLYLIWQNGRIAPLSDDGREMLGEPVLLLPWDGQEVGYEGAGLIKVCGKYVLYAAEWNGDFRIDGTYDMMYSVADHLLGPYTPRRLLVPHGGHSCLFYDHSGALRYTIFGNDRTAPFRHGLGVGRIAIGQENGLLTLSPA